MSFLAPLYLIGALAIVGPIIFHLIRRQPKNQVKFSSLMFLEETPPKITRRSRLQNIPLLLLRCLVIGLLALAFARPFLPDSAVRTVAGQRESVIFLIDQSASMRRAGVWGRAKEQFQAALGQLSDTDYVSVIAFDERTITQLSLQESAGLPDGARVKAAEDAFNQLDPTWYATNLGSAIRFAADQAYTMSADQVDQTDSADDSSAVAVTTKQRIILISDFQSGADIQSLQGYQWPQKVWVDARPAPADQPSNASVRVESLFDTENDSVEALRLAIQQSGEGNEDYLKVFLSQDGEQIPDFEALSYQVPSGATRFYSFKLPPKAPQSIAPDSDAPESETAEQQASTGAPAKVVIDLVGDESEFDNAFYYVQPFRSNQSVRYLTNATDAVGNEQEPSLRFYLEQLPWSDPTRIIQFEAQASEQFTAPPDPQDVALLVVPVASLTRQNVSVVDQFAKSGGHVLVVLNAQNEDAQEKAWQEASELLRQLLGAEQLTVTTQTSTEPQRIGGVDFQHRLTQAFTEPGVNDFSRIQIWKHRSLTGLPTDAKAVLALENQLPLLIDAEVPQDASEQSSTGRYWLLTSGWQPSESQFALSSKFVPIMLGMLGPNLQQVPESMTIGQMLDSKTVASQPGFLQREDGWPVAVNLSASESNTEPMDIDQLAQFGVALSTESQRAEALAAERALRDIELEAQQAWWQWLIAIALTAVILETVLSGRRMSQNTAASKTSPEPSG